MGGANGIASCLEMTNKISKQCHCDEVSNHKKRQTYYNGCSERDRFVPRNDKKNKNAKTT